VSRRKKRKRKKNGGRWGTNGEDVQIRNTKIKNSSSFWQWLPTKFSLPAIMSENPHNPVSHSGDGRSPQRETATPPSSTSHTSPFKGFISVTNGLKLCSFFSRGVFPSRRRLRRPFSFQTLKVSGAIRREVLVRVPVTWAGLSLLTRATT